MPDNLSLVNFGDISSVGVSLIEKISNAIGGIARPWVTIRNAKADAEAKKILAAADIEVDDMQQQRAMERFVLEEVRKQTIIEGITAKALPMLDDDANPKDVEDDWIAHFFDKCRLVSDQEMQLLWAKVLAGEVNTPGGFSIRTLNVISTMNRVDASIFQRLSNFVFNIGGKDVPMIFYNKGEIYTENGLTFPVLSYLDELGLIKFDHVAGYSLIVSDGHYDPCQLKYFTRSAKIVFEGATVKKFRVGAVLFTSVGEELIEVCQPEPVDGFFEYIVQQMNTNAKEATHSYEVVVE